MKFRARYKEGSREYRDVIDADSHAHARGKFAQAHPGSTLTSLEEIHPPARHRVSDIAAPAAPPVSDEQRAALRERAAALTRQLRTKLGVASKIRV